ncbi:MULTISPECIES: hypothetical protein [Arthrobacter]|uniref:protein adenylyltransferase n=2 Tax=Arthrobacter TaxID=1663 RepID=A0ABU9KNI6_9MICC|nr:hypothetical protein [Arthrobacter sp. YJM1]MDP5227955.1 hypothetical protein [Arthrobacter sp. YJM1]
MSDFTDPYCYPGTEVLINKLGLRDPRNALEIEREFSLLRRRELALDPVDAGFGLAHLQGIHRRLYQDVWDWAGLLRTVEISKGTSQFLETPFLKNAGLQIEEFWQSSTLLTDPKIGDAEYGDKAYAVDGKSWGGCSEPENEEDPRCWSYRAGGLRGNLGRVRARSGGLSASGSDHRRLGCRCGQP